jgi:N-acetylmuramoyl-L-alanine amidase
MFIKTLYSPNFSSKKRANLSIKVIVIHYTGMQSKIVSINRLLNKKAKVSCHYLIDRKGKILQMVDENKVAWHAGKSKWKNFKNLNDNSIGIELVNKGHEFGYEKFTSIQIKKLIKLCSLLKRKYKIKNSNILGHSDIAPLRKKDPGEKFPWEKLNKMKLGIWHKPFHYKIKELDKKKIQKLFFKNLHKIGYRYFDKKKRASKDSIIVKAFQSKFLPTKVNGKVDLKTYIISHFLANKPKN